MQSGNVNDKSKDFAVRIVNLYKHLVKTKEVSQMAVNYKKLFHLLIEKEMSNADLQKQAGFSANIITRLKRNEYIKLQSIESICNVLNCGVDDILDFVPDED